MTDLETWGTRTGCAIRSIGSVCFGPAAGVMWSQFYVNVDEQSCLDLGLHKDPKTEKWWADQSAAAQSAFDTDPALPLPSALEEFSSFWRRVQGREHWAHGPDFDLVILGEAYRVCGMTPPWNFWDQHSTRTIYMLAGIRPDRAKGTHHHALQDAIAQAEGVMRSYQNLGRGLGPQPAVLA